MILSMRPVSNNENQQLPGWNEITLDKLSTFKPFSLDPSLRNIVTGVVTKEDVNVHEFQTVGNEIIVKMVEKPIFGISFTRKDRAKTLADESSIKVDKDQAIDPALLFQ